MKIEQRGSLTAFLLAGLVGGGAVGGLGCTEPSPTPTPQRPSNRLILPTPTPQGLEGVTFSTSQVTPTVESKIELPPGWKLFKSEGLRYRIAAPSSWVFLPDPGPIKVADKFLGEVVNGQQNYLDISAWRARLFNDKGEWNTFEDYVTEESQMADYLARVSSKKEQEISEKGYWPRPIDGSKAWFLEIHNPSEKLLYAQVILIKAGRLFTLTYKAHYEDSSSGYLKGKGRFKTLVDSFKSP